MTFQVVRATGLRAASISGTSDPQCKVILGSHISYTRSLKKVLDPDWNETFVFSLDPADIATMNGPPMIHFEVWSHNEVAANDFLGEVCINSMEMHTCTDATYNKARRGITRAAVVGTLQHLLVVCLHCAWQLCISTTN